ncbi:MAG: hypothetical protein ACJA0G_001623, partial [Kangiellaceae bacterium]
QQKKARKGSAINEQKRKLSANTNT